MGSLLTNSFWMLQTASRSTLVQQQEQHATDDPALSSEQSAEQHRQLLTNDHPHYFEQLMYKYGSDKSKDDHGYTDLYQMLLDPVRHGIQNVTEVGVSAGQGLQAMYHYFPNAVLHGYDIATLPSIPKILANMKDRVRFTETDLLKATDLAADAGLYNETMDLVIDDASHMFWQQQALLAKLFALVKPGGYYIIEDIAYNHLPSRKWHEAPELLEPAVQAILQEHDAVFVDTHIGHRDWAEWLKRTVRSGVAVSHWSHNSYLMVIRKRVTPPPPVQINLRTRAMIPGQVLIE
jgi:SAM-dependent methyltransferase